jgi:hypothetical protein
MSAQQLVLAVAVGAAAIALWLDVRLESRTPRTVTWTLVHLGGSIFALRVMPLLVTLVVGGSEDPARKVAATLLVLLPVLTYCWLSAIWFMKLVQRATQFRL